MNKLRQNALPVFSIFLEFFPEGVQTLNNRLSKKGIQLINRGGVLVLEFPLVI